MKIIHVITAFGIGGAEKLLLNIINEQIKHNEVHLIYFKKLDDLIPFLDKRIQVKQISLSLVTIYRLKKYFKSIKPDIIHTHLGHADLLGIFSAKKTFAKIFTTIHSTSFKKNGIDYFFFLLYRLVLKKVKRVQFIAISKSVENLIENSFKVSKTKIHLLYNAIPNLRFNFKKENSNILNILFVGRLAKAKSLDTLIKSLILLKEERFKLTIVGEGSLKKELEKLTKELKITNRVTFVGKQEDVNQYYKEADVFILPSIWEGFGIVILEAFRSKTAVIASNIEGPAELINHNKNGLLFQPKNERDLASKIKILLEQPELRKRIAKEGHKSFSKKYHINTYVDNLQKLYNDA